jgi:hypothetical protein
MTFRLPLSLSHMLPISKLYQSVPQHSQYIGRIIKCIRNKYKRCILLPDHILWVQVKTEPHTQSGKLPCCWVSQYCVGCCNPRCHLGPVSQSLHRPRRTPSLHLTAQVSAHPGSHKRPEQCGYPATTSPERIKQGCKTLQHLFKVHIYHTTWHHIPPDHNLDTHHHKNLKSQIRSTVRLLGWMLCKLADSHILEETSATIYPEDEGSWFLWNVHRDQPNYTLSCPRRKESSWSTRRKSAPVLLSPPQIPHDLTQAQSQACDYFLISRFTDCKLPYF